MGAMGAMRAMQAIGAIGAMRPWGPCVMRVTRREANVPWGLCVMGPSAGALDGLGAGRGRGRGGAGTGGRPTAIRVPCTDVVIRGVWRDSVAVLHDEL